MSLFPIPEYWVFYLAFSTFVLLMLALDLGVFHRQARAVSFRDASVWSGIWISMALAFGFLLTRFAAWQFGGDARLMATPGFDPEAAARTVGLQFFTGYAIEKALSLDNIFVFVVVFKFFRVPAALQHRILFYGIGGALVFRGVFIALGAALLQYEWVVLLFGALLIGTGVKMFFGSEKETDFGKNPLIRLVRRLLPVTDDPHETTFFTRVGGVRYATPLLLALVGIEVSDIVFAMDSVPAIFAVTPEPLIVFTSNVFAILGLRSLYFLLAGAVERFRLVKYGLALVLVFVGLKMVWLNDAFGGEFPIAWSLGIIVGVIAASIAGSLLFTAGEGRKGPDLAVEQK